VGGTRARTEEVMTEDQYQLLIERRNDIGLAKMYRRTKGKGEIAKHYRDELKRMQEARTRGEAVSFEEWL
jgi:hypothetical protein